jgi:hypothetical protein
VAFILRKISGVFSQRSIPFSVFESLLGKLSFVAQIIVGKKVPHRDYFEGRRLGGRIVDGTIFWSGYIRDKTILSWLAGFRNESDRVDTKGRGDL